MFEQTFIKADVNDKKRYTVVASLLLQVGALGVLIVAPLIYTQVLPQAKLRSVFAAPTPPPPAWPKAPASVRSAAVRPSFHAIFVPLDRLPTLVPKSSEPAIGDAPVIAEGVIGSDSDATGPIGILTVKPPDPPQQAPAAPPAQSKRVRVAVMQESQLIHKVQPAYPQMAKITHVQGVVEFTAMISKSGTIENLQLLHGHPLLVTAAREAILQWRYKPTLLNGEPVEVITNIFVNFTLSGQ